VSLPLPPAACSIVTPRAIAMFATSPPTEEKVAGLRLMTCLAE
jgi:hypothetical protein